MSVQPPIQWTSSPACPALADDATCTDWNRLNAQRGNHTILDAHALRAALDVFGEGNEMLVVGRDREGLAAMMIVRRSGALQWQTFQPSQLPLGAVVTRSGVALAEMAASAIQAMPGLCWVLSLTQVDPLPHERPAASKTLRVADYIPTAWLEVAGSFDDYWATRGKNLRQNLRKQRKKLADEGRALKMLMLRSPDEMPAAIARYGALESSGWKSAEGTAIHPDNAQGRFYTRWLQDAATIGEALVTEYRFDDRTVAMNLGLLRDGTLIVLKTAYDESLKAVSPAFLLREDELRAFFAGTEVKRIEYFGRVMEWHTRLTDHQRTLYHLTQYRWAWLRRLLEARRRRTPAKPQGAALAAEACADRPSTDQA